MKTKEYEREMRRLHGELVALQEWVKATGAKVCIVFEGRDTAGKGGTIKRITERVSPRVFRIVALTAPTDREKSQMYIQRYLPHFPAAGEVIIFDRSWYNRAGVEPVMGFCTPEDRSARFLELVPTIEKAMVDSGIILIKYWLEVGPDEQTRRLEGRINDPRKIWKLSDMDLLSYSRWFDYSRARDDMFRATDTSWAPWFVAHTDDKKRGRLNIISHLLEPDPVRAVGAQRDDQTAQAEDRPRLRRTRTSRCATFRRSSEPATGSTATTADHRRSTSRAKGTAMSTTGQDPTRRQRTAGRWYALSPTRSPSGSASTPPRGLTAATAAQRLQQNGPNALPAEKAVPGWRRFLDEYRSYMQIILLIAAVVSLAIGEWSTGAVLALLTVVNAMVGLRQAGKAESAMNALKSLTKRTARVRRDGVEASIPAEQVVIGDLVLLAAGDDVAADGRIIQASSLDIDESALTGESTPSSKETTALADKDLGPGDQVNMAFMNTPVTHGSGGMLVTAVGARRPGREDRRHAGVHRQGADAADQAAEHADAVDRRGRARHDDRDVRPRACPGGSRPTPCSSPRSRWPSRRSRRRCPPSCR